MTPNLHEAKQLKLEHVGQRAGADEGDPQVSLIELYDDGCSDVGVWECTPGSWLVENRPDTETVYVVSGKGVIEHKDGSTLEISEGSVFVLPKGWSGRWRITETLRKVYVIVS